MLVAKYPTLGMTFKISIHAYMSLHAGGLGPHSGSSRATRQALAYWNALMAMSTKLRKYTHACHATAAKYSSLSTLEKPGR